MKVYTTNNVQYLEERFNEIVKELRTDKNYPYAFGRLESIVEYVIKEIKGEV